MTYQVMLKGEPIELAVIDCVVHPDGEFAHNLDLVVVGSRAVKAEDVHHLLEVQVPGRGDRLSAIAFAQEGDGVGVTFYLEGQVDDPADLREVTLYWDQQPLGDVPCEQANTDANEQALALSRVLVKKDGPSPVAIIVVVVLLLVVTSLYLAGTLFAS